MGAHSKREDEPTRPLSIRKLTYRGRHGDEVDFSQPDDPTVTVVDPATDRREARSWLVFLLAALLVTFLAFAAARSLGGAERPVRQVSVDVSPSSEEAEDAPPTKSTQPQSQRSIPRPSPLPRITVYLPRSVPRPAVTVTATATVTALVTKAIPTPAVTVTVTEWVWPSPSPTDVPSP